MNQAERVGCVGLATDAKDEAVAFYVRFGFVPLAERAERGTQLHFLPMRYFEGAVKAKRPG